jgi:HEAT repeat protein
VISLIRRHFRPAKQLFVLGLLLCVGDLSLAPTGHGQTNNVDQLIDRLKDPDFNVRIEAAKALGKTNDSRAVEPLIAALNDANRRVRHKAAESLGEIKDPRAVEPLLAALKGPDIYQKQYAADALGNIRDPRAVEPLIAALNDVNPNVRLSAAVALGEMKDLRAIEPLIVALKETPESREGSIHPQEDQERVATALTEIGTPAVEPLIAALKNTDAGVRDWAAELLVRIGDPRAVDPLLAAWKQHDLAAIAGAYTIFIKLGEPGSEDLLIEALNQFGSPGMARDFLNCGDSKLESAAATWARSHDFRIDATFGSATPGGGSVQVASARGVSGQD